jgi:hypothetical protein
VEPPGVEPPSTCSTGFFLRLTFAIDSNPLRIYRSYHRLSPNGFGTNRERWEY